ncbi:MAG: type II toxin-antitoxin system death-on-curing family toxin [Parvularculaceae bacterium]|nr:type II toxin-antitoxin system death-on-curing family toxin [Parvularculaceae bacterium]
MEVRWLTREIVLAIHARSLRDHGGAAGLRDDGMLEGALGRPQNLAAYGSPDVFELAASYAFALVKNHPFLDGNKRTAFLAAYVFLGLNGFEPDADEAEAAAIVVDLAASNVSEADFARWLEAVSRRI